MECNEIQEIGMNTAKLQCFIVWNLLTDDDTFFHYVPTDWHIYHHVYSLHQSEMKNRIRYNTNMTSKYIPHYE